jgi:3-deoxy-D-manno-octulosonic-acid transferase
MNRVIYNILLFLYELGIRIISPWNKKARLWIRGRQDIGEKLERIHSDSKGRKVVWMHCASLGEFEQGRPLLEMIREKYPGAYIVLSFFSPSGYEIRKNYNGAEQVIYLPMDSRHNASRFLRKVKPALVLWVKYEYWYYYLHEIGKRKIPLLLVSGIFRQDQPFFKPYGGLHRKMLTRFTHFFVQSHESRSLLQSLGFTNVTVSGDTRFDRVVTIAESFKPISSIEKFCKGHQVIVAGSTWPDDEEELHHYANTHPDTRFVIAPHEIGEEHLSDIEGLFKTSIRFSRWEEIQSSGDSAPNVLIIDNIGMLSRLYYYATISYIGGGFGQDGIHNCLEAAVYGKPVVFGPVYDKYIEAVELIEAGGAFTVENALELERRLDTVLKDEEEREKAGQSAAAYVNSKRGASATIMKMVETML